MLENIHVDSTIKLLRKARFLVLEASSQTVLDDPVLLALADIAVELYRRQEHIAMRWITEQGKALQLNDSNMPKFIEVLEDFLSGLDKARILHKYTQELLDTCKAKKPQDFKKSFKKFERYSKKVLKGAPIFLI